MSEEAPKKRTDKDFLYIVSDFTNKSVTNSPDHQPHHDEPVVAIYCPDVDKEKISTVAKRYNINLVINPPSLKIFKIDAVCHYNSGLLDKTSKQLMIEALEYGRRIEPFLDHIERTRGLTEIELLHDAFFLHQKAFSMLSNKFSLNSKRLLDLTLSVVALIFLSPIMLLTAIAIKLESKGPVIFKQARTGQYNKEFKVLKFRSMNLDAEKNGAQWARKKDPRITRVGSFIRKTRIDELPQLINVIKGEMSIIGPRPEREIFIEELEKTIPYYRFRHAIRPGITGLAQIRYRYGASIEDAKWKHRYDLYYIKNQNIILDIKIIFKTIGVVFGAKGT